VRMTLIVFLPPSLDQLLCLGQCPEPVGIQALKVPLNDSTKAFARIVNCTLIGECRRTFPGYSSFSSMAGTRV